jgi:hypothetical protein
MAIDGPILMCCIHRDYDLFQLGAINPRRADAKAARGKEECTLTLNESIPHHKESN